MYNILVHRACTYMYIVIDLLVVAGDVIATLHV